MKNVRIFLKLRKNALRKQPGLLIIGRQAVRTWIAYRKKKERHKIKDVFYREKRV